MITEWETNFTDLQANEVGNLRKNNSGKSLVGNHAVIFTESNSLRRAERGPASQIVAFFVLLCLPLLCGLFSLFPCLG